VLLLVLDCQRSARAVAGVTGACSAAGVGLVLLLERLSIPSVPSGMVWYDQVAGRAQYPYTQTESVPSALVRRWVSFPQAPAVAELRACAISLCLELQPPSSTRRRAAQPPCRW
jgi:hypothetical protein